LREGFRLSEPRPLWLTMKNVFIGVACLAVGAGCGFLAGRHSALQAEFAPIAAEDGTKAELAKARDRIVELEARLKAARHDAADKAKSEVAEVAEDKGRDEKSETAIEIAGDADVESQLKKQLTDEQFTQVTNAFAELKARLTQRAKNRYDYLSSVDASKLGAKEKLQHERYLELFAKREAVREKMKNGIPDAGVIEEMVKLGIEMTPLAKQERAMLTRQVAQELGYQGDDVEVFHDTMQQIYDCTNPGGLGGLEDIGSLGVGVDTSVGFETKVIAE